LSVSAILGTLSDSGNAWLGIGLGFGSCVDSSAYYGVKFSINGDIGNCGLTFAAMFSEDNGANDNPAFGSCTSSSCYPPASGTIAHGPMNATITVPFANLVNGCSPQSSADTRAITVQWQLN
jgi:hypothetical protein